MTERSGLGVPFGSYLLLKSLGSGAMGDVQLARPADGKSDVPLVIKRLHRELATNERFVKRFQHEAEIATSIDSVHVAKVYEVGQVDGVLYITMEFIEGWPLSRIFQDAVTSRRRISLRSVADIVTGSLEGLRALHSVEDRGGQSLEFVHRDIAPKNMMVGRDGITRLIDLGLGKSRMQDWKTATGAVLGTPGYMAPEQARGGRVDSRTDLYAMGVVLYEALTLRSYIEHGNIASMIRRAAAPVFKRPSHHRADVSEDLDRVVERALAVSPEDRFQSAGEFIAALARAIPPRAPSDGDPMQTLIGEMLWSELDEKTVEVKRLLSLPLRDPTLVRGDDATLAPTVVAARDAPRRAGGRPTISLPRSLVFAAPVVMLAAGVGVGLLVPRLGGVREEPAVSPPSAREEARPAAEVIPSVTARASSPEVDDRAEEDRDRADRARRRAPTPKPLPSEEPVKVRPELPQLMPLEALQEQIAKLEKRARELSRSLPEGSVEKDRARQLIIDLNAESAHPDAERVARLAERARALEAK